MGHISPEYGHLRHELGSWFTDGQWRFADQQTTPVYAGAIGSGSVERDGPAWEVRAGSIGDEYLSCSGLAVVVRKGMQERDGVFRVDVYDPQPDLRGRLPAPNDPAARLFYGPSIAAFAESAYPDAPPVRQLGSNQFRTMQLLMQHLKPFRRGTVVDWAHSYEQLGASQTTGGMHPLLILLSQELKNPGGSNGQAA